MKRMLLALKVLTLAMLFVSSCNEPSPLGAELIEGDQVNIVYTDTLSFNTTTVKEDSVLVFDPNPSLQYTNFFIGDYNDPIFGNTKAELNGQLWPNVNTPNFAGAICDSLILLLRYDSTNTYGDLITEPYNLNVYRITENIDLDRKYYSSDFFEYNMADPLGETGEFFPRYSSADTLTIFDYTFPPSRDTITQAAHLRIPLSKDFANELMDSTIYSSTSNFLELFKGIVVKAESETDGILSFNLASTLSGMTLYYHTIDDSQDTIFQQYKYIYSPNGGVYFSNFKHTFSDRVEAAIENKTIGDSITYLQSLSGPNVKIEFPNVDKLGDIIVNKAELTFTIADLNNNDLEIYLPLDNSIIAVEDDVNGGFAFISDVLIGSPAGVNFFGGSLEESMDDQGAPIYIYKYNISSHFQRIVEGTADNSIFIRSFPKQERARRAVLYGPKHSIYPVTFDLTYTKLDP